MADQPKEILTTALRTSARMPDDGEPSSVTSANALLEQCNARIATLEGHRRQWRNHAFTLLEALREIAGERTQRDGWMRRRAQQAIDNFMADSPVSSGTEVSWVVRKAEGAAGCTHLCAFHKGGGPVWARPDKAIRFPDKADALLTAVAASEFEKAYVEQDNRR